MIAENRAAKFNRIRKDVQHIHSGYLRISHVVKRRLQRLLDQEGFELVQFFEHGALPHGPNVKLAQNGRRQMLHVVCGEPDFIFGKHFG